MSCANPAEHQYENLFRQMSNERVEWQRSARIVLSILFRHFVPRSVVDVGCGRGFWLKAALELGVPEVAGVDGTWLPANDLEVDASLVGLVDLERPFRLGQRFDLVLCLEVAEHVSRNSAEGLIDSLVAHGPAVLFSAAIPLQGGPGHVHERFPEYWADLFRRRGYVAVDCIRPVLWMDSDVQWWYRQNTLLFVDRPTLDALPTLKRESEVGRPLSIVYPGLYYMYARKLRDLKAEYDRLIAFLGGGGTFTLSQLPDGTFEVKKG